MVPLLPYSPRQRLYKPAKIDSVNVLKKIVRMVASESLQLKNKL